MTLENFIIKKYLFIIIFIIFTNNLFSQDLILTKEEQLFLKNNPVLKIGYTPNFEPNYIKYEGGVEGIIPDLYNLISLKLGIKFNYVTDTWKNTLESATYGKIDIIPMIVPEIAKERNLLIASKLYSHLFRVFTKENKQYALNSIEDMKGLKIAYVKDIIVLDKFLKKHINPQNLIAVNTTLEAFNKVLNNNADLAISFNTSGQFMIKNNFLSQLKSIYILEELQIESVSATTPKKPILRSIITKAIDSITYDEKLKIFKRWTKVEENKISSPTNLLNEKEISYLDKNHFDIYYNKKGWFPFIFAENNNPKGISAEIWNEITRDVNINTNYNAIDTFTQILELFKKNPRGIVTVTSSTDDKEKYASFTKPYASFPLAIVTNIKEDFLIDMKELEGKTVALGNNYTAHRLLQKYYPKINFVPVKDIQTALDQVANGKVFAAADVLPVINYELNRLGYKNLKVSGTSRFNVDLQIMVNKKSSELIPILNKLIDNMDIKKKQYIIYTWLHQKNIEKIDHSLAYLITFIAIIIIAFILYRQRILRLKEKSINKERRKYQTLIELSSDGILILNKKGDVIHFSKNAREMLGLSSVEMQKATIYKFDKNITHKEYMKTINTLSDKPLYIEREFTRKDQSSYIAGLTVTLIDIDNEDYIYTSARDISKEKEILRKLKIDNSRFEGMFKKHASIMLLIDPNTNYIVDANKSATNFYGYSHDEFLRMKLPDISILGEKELQEKRKNALEYKKNTFISPHKLKNGQMRTVEVNVSPIETNNGIILFSIIKDITKQKELENQIVKEKDFISTIVNSANAVIAVIDKEGRMFRVNKYVEEFTGFTAEEIASEPYFWSKFLPEEEKVNVLNIIKKANQGEIVKFFKNSWFSKNKEKRVFEWSNILVSKEDGSMDYLVTIGIDITEKELIQKEILEQKVKFESIFKHSKDGILITDLETNFLDFNDAHSKIVGFTREELFKKSCLSFIIPEQIDKFKIALNSVLEGNNISNFEQKCIVKDGKRITVNMSISLLPDKKRLLLIIKDVSTIKQIEEQLRLASLGEMIGNIAHQWRQPLSIITTSASGLSLQQEILGSIDQKSLHKTTDKIIEQANYLSQTIDSFRNFIKDEKVLEKVMVSKIIKNALNIVDAIFINNFINVHIDTKNDLEIFANKNELQEALINILTNAKDVLVENIKEEDRLIFISTTKIDDSTLELKILDSGGGIKEEIINKIFEPYFTTRHQSIGTGLGLAMTDKIIRERHNFSLTVENEKFIYNAKKYYGASFTIRFTS